MKLAASKCMLNAANTLVVTMSTLIQVVMNNI